MSYVTRREFMEMFGGDIGISRDDEIDALVDTLNELTEQAGKMRAFTDCLIEQQTAEGKRVFVPGWRLNPDLYSMFRTHPEIIARLVAASETP